MPTGIKHTALNQSGLSLEARQWLRALGSLPDARFAQSYWQYMTGRAKASPAAPRGMSKQRADDIRTAVVLAIGRTFTIKPAPAVFVGLQERPGRAPVPLYNLTRGIPGHPKSSTVSGATLRAAGFTPPPPPPKKNPRKKSARNKRRAPEDDRRWEEAARYLTEIAEEQAGLPPGWRIPSPKKGNPRKSGRRSKARKNWPCPSENKPNPGRRRAGGDGARKLIYPAYTMRHGTTGRGLHVSGGRFYHKSGRRKVSIYGLPGGSLELKPHQGRLWGY